VAGTGAKVRLVTSSGARYQLTWLELARRYDLSLVLVRCTISFWQGLQRGMSSSALVSNTLHMCSYDELRDQASRKGPLFQLLYYIQR
jgi:hypothetical protein